MAGRKNPNELAIDAVLDEFRSIKKRGRRVKRLPAAASRRGQGQQWLKDRGIRKRDVR
jgi:hypothetical protein